MNDVHFDKLAKVFPCHRFALYGNLNASSCYFTTAVLNDCYNEAMAYTALAYSYWASFHDTYICLHHAHYGYRLQLPYKSHRTYLTNCMGSISHHITPLVINSLRGGHTHTQAYRHSWTEAILRNQACTSRRPARTWFKNNSLYSLLGIIMLVSLMHFNSIRSSQSTIPTTANLYIA